jgi:hypothetical protein
MQLDDLNFWRSVVTVASLTVFLWLVAKAWSRRSVSGFEEAAQLPFASEDVPVAPTSERK